MTRKSQVLTEREVGEIHEIVEELIMKGKRKRLPFSNSQLEIAIADGVGKINQLYQRHYPPNYQP